MTVPTLSIGARVRWRQGKSWRHGYLASTTPGVNNTLTVRPDRAAGTHTVGATSVQYETTGPRGGRRWEPITPEPRSAPKPCPARAAALPGQLDLFDPEMAR